MAFSDQFLDDLRARLPVSEVVGRKVTLKRQGAEHIGLSPFQQENSPSFTVNDQKGFYHDFSSGKNGDIFKFLMDVEGLDFRSAVIECAHLAGVSLPDEDRPRSKQANGHDGPPPSEEPPFDPDAYDRGQPGPSVSKREITKTYDYTDGHGALRYQVCRLEWEENGKRKKTFMQRRPSDDGHWIWGLSSGDFLRSRNGDWYQATKDRVEKWKGAERRTFSTGVQHGLYRLEELREEASADSVVFLTEGEKDVDTLREWGEIATTNSGGARHWSAEHAENFRGLDVILPIDNDQAGHDRAKILGYALRRVVKRLRVLDFAEVWKDAPKGADVTDWKTMAGGTVEKLQEIIKRLPDWRPPPHVSQFGGISFEQLDDPGPEHEYIIDGWLSVGDKSVIGGASKSGKSFFAIHMGMCIATQREFFGNKIMKPGLVIYQAGEGQRGVKKRFRAWRQVFGIPKGMDRVPIYILQSAVDIFSPEGDTAKLIDEIKAIERMYDMPACTLFIDTLAKASGAADENSGRDMGVVMGNIDKIMSAFPGMHTSLVHHMNAGGTKLRGHTSLYANTDQVILVAREEGTKVKVATLDKQKEGEDGLNIRFELPQIEIGYRQIDGKPLTSCVVLPAGGAKVEVSGSGEKRDRTTVLTDDQTNIMDALKEAIAEHGITPPPQLKLPPVIAKVCTVSNWYEAYRAVASKEDAAIRQAMARASDKFVRMRMIGRVNPYVWIVPGRVVAGLPDTTRADRRGGQPVQQEMPEHALDFSPR